MQDADNILEHLQRNFSDTAFRQQRTVDDLLTLWVPATDCLQLIRHLKSAIRKPYSLLYDLCAIDERDRTHRNDMPAVDLSGISSLLL